MSIIAISHYRELQHYNAELAAAEAEQAILYSLNEYNQSLQADIDALQEQITIFNVNSMRLQAQPVEESIDLHGIKLFMRQVWEVLLGLGIFLQELLPLAVVIKSFLFPVHFAIDGLRSLWDFRRLFQDRYVAHRRLKLAIVAFNIVGVIVAAIIVALAISNPFALPIVFFGLVGAVMVRDLYLLKQNKKTLLTLKSEHSAVIATISELKQTLALADPNHQLRLAARLNTLTAKQFTLESQLTSLREQRFELRRNVFFHVLSMVAIGLLITAAVACLLFPPVAIAIASAGLLLFAAVTITNVLSSPPVRAKMSRFKQWCKNKLSRDPPGYAPIVTEELQAEARIEPAIRADELPTAPVTSPLYAGPVKEVVVIAPPTPVTANVAIKPTLLAAGTTFFDYETRRPTPVAVHQAIYPFKRSHSSASFFKAVDSKVIEASVDPTDMDQTAHKSAEQSALKNH